MADRKSKPKRAAPKGRKPASKKAPAKKRPRAKAPAKKRRAKPVKVSPAALKACALAGVDMARAELELGVEGLGTILARNPAAAEAWDRGRMLFNVKALAVAGTPADEIAEHIGLTAAKFGKQLAKDAELADVLNQGRMQHVRTIRAGLMKSAVKGNQRAIETILRVVQKDAASTALDPHRLRVNQAVEFVGVSRVTLAKWARQGAPKNADGTVDLPRLIAWRIVHEGEVLGVRSGRGSGSEEDLRQERIRKLRLENDTTSGRMVLLDDVVASQVAIGRALVELLDTQERAFPSVLAGKDPRDVKRLVKTHNDDGRRRLRDALARQVPVPEKYAARVREFLAGLFGELMGGEQK